MTHHEADLLEMLTYCRPAGSPTERAFIRVYVASLPGAIQDMYGNWHVQQGSQRILWSCHTDTVHRAEGRQTVRYNPATMIASLSRRSKRLGRNCLGADDTAGVFLLRSMVLAGVPGHYVFHFGEERGGIGSRALATHGPELIQDSEIAIALDRRGGGDVIMQQFGDRCASDAFALSLAREIERVSPLKYAPAHGVYTDTAEYTGLIGECTNLSVGYMFEHSQNECLYLWHVMTLLDALCQIDPDRLVVERKPGEGDYADSWLQAIYPGVKADEPTDANELLEADNVYLDRVYADIQRALGRKDI